MRGFEPTLLCATVFALVGCGSNVPVAGDGNGETTSTGRDSMHGESTVDSSSSAWSTTVASSSTTSWAPDSTSTSTSTSSLNGSSTADASSSSSGGPALVCPGNPHIECYSLPDCDNYDCGSPFSELDASGCPRPRCDYYEDCPASMRCFRDSYCGSCIPPDYGCRSSENPDDPLECLCVGETSCAFGGYCLSEDEWPSECCPFDSEESLGCTGGR